MEINLFTPEEIVFLYLRHEKYRKVHDDVTESIKELNKEGVETQPSLRDLKNNVHIEMLNALNEKLKPIYEIIIDTHPEILSEIQRVVDNPMNLPDSPFEEEGDDNEDLF